MQQVAGVGRAQVKDWNNRDIDCAKSRGGVTVTAHPYENLIRTGCKPWPPAEIVQKLYQSRQIRAFSGNDETVCTSGLGFYCDLQSIHSEDAITWSVFGTAARAPQSQLEAWIADLLLLLDLPRMTPSGAELFLWRRIPHPDNLVPGGPEIDIGISTANGLILGEAKWQAGVGVAQGKNKDKDQIQLRGEFLRNYAPKFYPSCSEYVVLGISLFEDAFEDTTPEGVAFRCVTWDQVCALPSHPCSEELGRYVNWKKKHTNMANKPDARDGL
ncbi:hypothetical protein LGV61_11910 [Desulfurispirillum indicum]|uniref:hypothetical protein n=1 Tax=Desulfurispirillum indicum TaxID=936456 RepID=UPI001CFA7FF9|nr:hypothetical protein [Desulfurispirillum indicum]UCZ56419.1 hypothetical protein LGV61_11910 [Desulfurispirillum indicum]